MLLFIISESRAMIIGSEDLYIHEGSPVSLQCRVEDSAGPPAYIYWYKGGEVINYSNQKHIEISYSSLDTNPVSTLVIKVSQTVRALSDWLTLYCTVGGDPRRLRELHLCSGKLQTTQRSSQHHQRWDNIKGVSLSYVNI